MQENKRYEILESLPTYGPMYVPVNYVDAPIYSEGFVVRFYKTDGTQWVANFQPGWTGLKGVFEMKDTTNLLVIAFGYCYLMNPDQAKPLSDFGVSYSEAFSTKDGRLILKDETNLTVIEPTGKHWHTERISLDGLKEVNVDKNIVTGLASNPKYDSNEWVKFSYNIDTKELIGGSFSRPDKIKRSKWWFW